MDKSERTNPPFLPLGEAATRLGISSDALRMRVKRGKARGFKQAGRVYVYLPEQTEWPVRATSEQTEQTGSVRSLSGTGQGAAPLEEVSSEAIPVIIEFQKVELSRLLKENGRLNRRYDQLMEELKHLRGMQQREQVLRQQELGLRRQLQTALDRLRPALPRPAVTGSLTKAKVRAARSPGPTRPARPPADQHPAPPSGRPDPAPPADSGPNLPAAVNPDVLPPITDDEAADLADILKDVGQSLRDLEDREPPLAAPPPAYPGKAPHGEPDLTDSAAAQSRLRADERRKAGRVMKRLFRSRNGPEPDET